MSVDSVTSYVVSAGTMNHSPRFWEKAGALLNMDLMSVTPETFQEFRGWLKKTALLNIDLMSVTPETFPGV